jgi:hypothetical protein
MPEKRPKRPSRTRIIEHIQPEGSVYAAHDERGLRQLEKIGLKRPRDPAQLAKLMIDIASGEVEDREPTPEELGKSPLAVKRGRIGGLKGGKVRADRLSGEKKKDIARLAATARWRPSRKP